VGAELKAAYPDSTIELIKGGGGIFDIKCDGILIYSKHSTQEDRFPKDGEITKILKEKSS